MAFDLTKPKVLGTVSFDQAFADTRENFRAIVQGDSGVVTMQDVGGIIRSTGAANVPASGAGAELAYNGTQAIFQGFNRTGAVWVPAWLRGSTVTIGHNNVSDFFIDSSGQVGIGGAASATKLMVTCATGSYAQKWTDGAIVGSVYIGNPDGLGSAFLVGSASAHPLRFFTNANAPSMTLDTSGNFAIGALPSTSARLEVYGTQVAGFYNSAVYDTAAMAAGVGAGFGLGGHYTAAGAYTQFGIIKGIKENATDNDYSGALLFFTRMNLQTFLERVRINSAGQVIINQSSVPNSDPKLCISGAIFMPGTTVPTFATGAWIWSESAVGLGIQGGGTLRFRTGGSTTDAVYITAARDLVSNGSNANLATTATGGFLWLAAMAGAPTGAPGMPGGNVPIVFDTTNNKLWVYNGAAWKGVALA